MDLDSPRIKVIIAMMKLDRPQNIYRIAKEAGLQVKHVDYWVHKLIEEGVVLCTEEAGARLYFLQPIFYDQNFARTFDRIFDRMHTLVKSKLEAVEDREQATFNSMLMILEVIRHQRRV